MLAHLITPPGVNDPDALYLKEKINFIFKNTEKINLL